MPVGVAAGKAVKPIEEAACLVKETGSSSRGILLVISRSLPFPIACFQCAVGG